MLQGMKSFAFDLNEQAPELLFDPKYEEEEIDWFPVVNELFWSLNLDRVSVRYGDTELTLCEEGGDRECWIAPDSGTSAITFPSWAHK